VTCVRGALAIGCMLSAVRTGGAEPCTPRASLDGDAEAVARVSAELERLGVKIEPARREAVTSSRGCPIVVAAVELDRGGGIAVAVRDATKRSEGRVVSDAALAAAWIDSWLHDDFEVPAVAAPPAPVAAPRLADTVVAAPARPSLLERLSLAGSYEQAWTDTSDRWSGFGVAACARFGELCFGARVRYLTESILAQLTAAARSELSAVATASWTTRLGEMSIAPELGLGVGRTTTARIDGCPPKLPPCDPTTDPTCPPPPPPCTSGTTTTNAIYVGDHFHTATVSPRAEAGVRVTVPLFPHVWLDGIVGVTLAPFAHTDSYPAQSVPPGVTTDQISLPGEPLAAFQLGVGLRVGGR
jgi:hypothetical protein